MSYIPPAVIDADSHVIENELTWDHLEPAEQKYRPKIIAQRNDPMGFDRIVAVFPGGRAYMWRQLNGQIGQ